MLARDAKRDERQIAVRRAEEVPDRRDADRFSVQLGDQVEIGRLFPALDDDSAGHRVLRMHAIAHLDVEVDLVVAELADGGHAGSGSVSSSGSLPPWRSARPWKPSAGSSTN